MRQIKTRVPRSSAPVDSAIAGSDASSRPLTPYLIERQTGKTDRRVAGNDAIEIQGVAANSLCR